MSLCGVVLRATKFSAKRWPIASSNLISFLMFSAETVITLKVHLRRVKVLLIDGGVYLASKVPDLPPDLWTNFKSLISILRSTALHIS